MVFGKGGGLIYNHLLAPFIHGANGNLAEEEHGNTPAIAKITNDIKVNINKPRETFEIFVIKIVKIIKQINPAITQPSCKLQTCTGYHKDLRKKQM